MFIVFTTLLNQKICEMSDVELDKCILCPRNLSKNEKPEHILLDALGGRCKTSRVICSLCNEKMGGGPDSDLAKSTLMLRNACGLKSGSGGSAPQMRGLETDGERFDLMPGMQARMRPKDPMSVSFDEDQIAVSIQAQSEEEADKLLTAAANKIAKHLGHDRKEIIEAIKKDLAKDRQDAFRPAPAIRGHLEFGQGQSQQSMAKACLVLWAKCVSNAEVNSERYDRVRAFVWQGQASEESKNISKIDTRPLPDLPADYGTNPNIVWAGSDENGQVYGYFRLYGAIGWRFDLCGGSGPPNLQICLISNPFDNSVWDLLYDDKSPILINWVKSDWKVYPPNFNSVQVRIESMLEYAHNLSQNMWLEKLAEEAFAKAGCGEGEVITEEHIARVSEYVTPALAAVILKTTVPRK